jgi:hypothetical protein
MIYFELNLALVVLGGFNKHVSFSRSNNRRKGEAGGGEREREQPTFNAQDDNKCSPRELKHPNKTRKKKPRTYPQEANAKGKANMPLPTIVFDKLTILAAIELLFVEAFKPKPFELIT